MVSTDTAASSVPPRSIACAMAVCSVSVMAGQLRGKGIFGAVEYDRGSPWRRRYATGPHGEAGAWVTVVWLPARGRPPEAAARRAGLEFVEKLLPTNLTSMDTQERNAGMLLPATNVPPTHAPQRY